MTSDDIYNDLYGVSPGVIAVIMALFTILTPYAIVPSWWVLGYPLYLEPDIIYSLFWALGGSEWTWHLYVFTVYNPLLLWTTLPLGFVNAIYALKIVRYYQDRATKDSVLRWAGAAFMVPIIVMYIQGQTWILLGLFDPTILWGSFSGGYFGPIPIQIAAGLLLIHRIRAPELVTPWTDPERDESWWIEEEPEVSCVGRVSMTLEELDEIYQIWD